MFKTSELNTILNPKQLVVGTNGGLELMTGPQVALGITLDMADAHITGDSSVNYENIIDRIEIKGNSDYVEISGASLFAIMKSNGSLSISVTNHVLGTQVPIEELADTSTDYLGEIDTGKDATTYVTISGIIPVQFGKNELPKVRIVWAAEASYSETPNYSVVTGTCEFTQFFGGKEPKIRTYFRESYKPSLATGAEFTETLPVIQQSNLDCVGTLVKSLINVGGGGIIYNIDQWKLNIKNGSNKVLEVEDTMLTSIKNWLGDGNCRGQGAYTTVGNVPSSTNLLLWFRNNTGATIDLVVWYMFRKGA